MSNHDLRRLLKCLRESQSLGNFIQKVVSHLKWFNIPPTWTKASLIEFYQLNGGKN
jgi:hypothetical protein